MDVQGNCHPFNADDELRLLRLELEKGECFELNFESRLLSLHPMDLAVSTCTIVLYILHSRIPLLRLLWCGATVQKHRHFLFLIV